MVKYEEPVYILVDVNSGDVTKYKSLADMARSIEPVDVKEGAYEVFDWDGRCINLIVRENQRKLLGFMSIKDEAVHWQISERMCPGEISLLIDNFADKHGLSVDKTSLRSRIDSLGDL